MQSDTNMSGGVGAHMASVLGVSTSFIVWLSPLKQRKPCYHVATMLLDCLVYALIVEISNKASGDHEGQAGMCESGSAEGKASQRDGQGSGITS